MVLLFGGARSGLLSQMVFCSPGQGLDGKKALARPVLRLPGFKLDEGDWRELWREGRSMVLRGGACVGRFFFYG